MKKLVFGLAMLSLFSMISVLAQSTELSLGEPTTGTLTEDQLVVDYSFSANEGDRLTISASSSEFDTFLSVIDSEGEIVASNDDANGSLNSQIDTFVVTRDDDYILSVTSSDGTGIGDYELVFMQAQLQTLGYGDSVQGSLDEGTPEVIYQFEGQKGDIITIQMTSSIIDSFVTLANSEYEMISDDDTGGANNAMIGAYSLPATDTYTIRAFTYGYPSYGEFMITLDQVEATPIKLNDSIRGTISNKPLYYSFVIDSGTLVSVQVVSEDGLLDTILNIQHATYGYSLGFDDDGGFMFDPEVNNMFINEAGQYIITVLPAVPNTKGNFELRITTKPTNTLECDSSQTLSYNQKTSQILYTMDVETRQTVTLTFFGNDSSLESLYTNVTIGGEYLPVDFINDVDGQTIVEIKPPVSGQLNINVSDYAFRLHTFQLDVDCE